METGLTDVARWKENLSASLRVKQCVRLWWMKARQTWLFVYIFPKMCQKSWLISDSASACKAGSSCLDLSQHVTVTEAKMKDLMLKRSWPPTCVFSQLSSCFGPNSAFIHIACWGPTPIFLREWLYMHNNILSLSGVRCSGWYSTLLVTLNLLRLKGKTRHLCLYSAVKTQDTGSALRNKKTWRTIRAWIKDNREAKTNLGYIIGGKWIKLYEFMERLQTIIF